jgi:hypothetical protein
MEKTFTVTGVSERKGEVKVRFANDMDRVKTLIKTGHIDINLFELPQPMTRMQIAVYLQSIDFANGDPVVEQAVNKLADKYKVSTKETTTTTEMVDAAIL